MRKSLSLLTIFAVLLAGGMTFAGKGNGNGGGGGGGGTEPPPTLAYRYEISYDSVWDQNISIPSGLNDYGDVVNTPIWAGLGLPVDPVLYRFADNTEYSINAMIQADFADNLLDVDPALIDPDTGLPIPMAYVGKINNRGQIALGYHHSDDNYLGCLYTPPTVDANNDPVAGSLKDLVPAELLDLTTTKQMFINGLNEDGDVLLEISNSHFVYLSAGGPIGAPTLLTWEDMAAAAPGADAFTARALNNRYIDANGDVALQFAGDFVTGSSSPVRYTFNLNTSVGSITEVPLANPNAITRSPVAINMWGDVVGREWDGSGTFSGYTAFAYFDGASQAIVIDTQGVDEEAEDINDFGDIVGRAEVLYKKPKRQWVRELFLYTDGTTYLIRSLIDGESNYDGIYPLSINNEGQILARAYDYNGAQHILLLTPYTP